MLRCMHLPGPGEGHARFRTPSWPTRRSRSLAREAQRAWHLVLGFVIDVAMLSINLDDHPGGSIDASISTRRSSSSRSDRLFHADLMGVRGKTIVPERESSRMPKGRISL